MKELSEKDALIKCISIQKEMSRLKKEFSELFHTSPQSTTKEEAIFLEEDHRNQEELYRYPPPVNLHAIENKWNSIKKQVFNIDNKQGVIIDDFFTTDENKQLITFVNNSTFSDTIYGSAEGVVLGEIPAKKLTEKKSQELLLSPPPPIKKLHDLFYFIGEKINAYTFSLPKKTCIPNLTCTGNVASNYVTEVSKNTMKNGFHKDYDPEYSPQYLLPKLYENSFYPAKFINGSPNSPYLITCMNYIQSDSFSSENDGMGTLFQNEKEKITHTVQCQQGRLVFFEGNIQHSLQQSFGKADEKRWRVSFVWLLCFLPKSTQILPLQSEWKKIMTP
jgi:hypothetical protein